jgi:hypothetical protein
MLFSIIPTYNLAFADGSKVGEVGEEEEEIILLGPLENGTIRSIFKPFNVIKNSYSISIYYLQNLSNIDVEIVDDLGQVVYSNNVNATYGENLRIDILNWPAGNYTIHFSNSSGNSICGNFKK